MAAPNPRSVDVVAPVGTSPSPAGSRAIVDFAGLLATPASGRSPDSPVGASDSDADHDIARSTVGEKIAVVLAVVLPPIGLVAAIVAAIASSRRRGWVIGLLQASVTVAAVLSLVLAIGGYVGDKLVRQQAQHQQIAAASAAFCATLTKDPSMQALPDFGWPAIAASIPDSIAVMQRYEHRWEVLAKISPAGIEPDVEKIATATKQIVGAVTAGRTIDDASDVATMSSLASVSGVPAWYREYCK